MGLPRSWWEGSERHIQLSVVEHHPQFKALPVSVSPGFYPQQPDLAVKGVRLEKGNYPTLSAFFAQMATD